MRTRVNDYVVKIHYPARLARSRGALIKTFGTRYDAVDFAKRVAGRSKRYHVGERLYTTGKNNPVACVYNLKSWGTAPECYGFKWLDTQVRSKRPALHSGRHDKTRGPKAASVVRVPYTMLGRWR